MVLQNLLPFQHSLNISLCKNKGRAKAQIFIISLTIFQILPLKNNKSTGTFPTVENVKIIASNNKSVHLMLLLV